MFRKANGNKAEDLRNEEQIERLVGWESSTGGRTLLLYYPALWVTAESMHLEETVTK